MWHRRSFIVLIQIYLPDHIYYSFLPKFPQYSCFTWIHYIRWFFCTLTLPVPFAWNKFYHILLTFQDPASDHFISSLLWIPWPVVSGRVGQSVLCSTAHQIVLVLLDSSGGESSWGQDLILFVCLSSFELNTRLNVLHNYSVNWKWLKFLKTQVTKLMVIIILFTEIQKNRFGLWACWIWDIFVIFRKWSDLWK